jgi:hypothetical protein
MRAVDLRNHPLLTAIALTALLCLSAEAEIDVGEKIAATSYTERPQALRALPLAEQVKALLSAMARTEPPDLRLPDVVAERGAAIIPYAAAAMSSATQDFDRVNLIILLARIQSLGAYDVRGDARLHALFDEAASRMRFPEYREMMLQDGQRIGWGSPSPFEQPTPSRAPEVPASPGPPSP